MTLLATRHRAVTDYSGSGCDVVQDVKVIEVTGMEDADFCTPTVWNLVKLPDGYTIAGEPTKKTKDTLDDIPF